MEDNVYNIIKKYNCDDNKLLKLSKLEKEELDIILKKLLNSRRIFKNTKNKYEIIKPDHIIGTLDRCSKGFSFIKQNDEKIIIPPNELHTALKNDTVVVLRTYENNGTICGIMKRKNKKLVCEVKEYNNKLILVPFNGNCEINIIVPNNLLKDYIIGDRCYIELDNSSDIDNNIVAKNITKIGHFNDKMNDELAIAISKDFDIDFSENSIEEASKIKDHVTNEEKANRIDLTKDNIFTIDSVHTKDMDDAISIKKLYNGNYLLGVHIADVAHYIKPNSSLFKEALKRGTSVYLGEAVIPMIPSTLSNGICSLNEGVERLTKSCIMEINPKGKLVQYKIVNSVIKSKKKMSYEELNEFFNGNEIDESYYPFLNDLNIMRELSDIMTHNKNNKGNLDFESSDIYINKDVYNNDKIIGFETRHNEEAQRIIENFMIAANEAVASHFYWRDLPFIYRVHNNPDDLKLENTIDIISKLNYKLIRIQNAYGQKAIQNILNDFKGTKEFTIISNLLLRSMSKAKYSTENIGHYALALDNYCHFTSPIRRFPDLMVHTLINIFINNDYSLNNHFEKEILNEIAEHSSYKERQANDAEKDYIKLKMAKFMSEHIGEEFTGMILDIEKDKVYIKLDNNIKGILDFEKDFAKSFSIDTYNRQLTCNYSKQKVKLGTRIIAKVSKVDIPQKEIYFDVKEIIKNNENSKNDNIKKLELK